MRKKFFFIFWVMYTKKRVSGNFVGERCLDIRLVSTVSHLSGIRASFRTSVLRRAPGGIWKREEEKGSKGAEVSTGEHGDKDLHTIRSLCTWDAKADEEPGYPDSEESPKSRRIKEREVAFLTTLWSHPWKLVHWWSSSLKKNGSPDTLCWEGNQSVTQNSPHPPGKSTHSNWLSMVGQERATQSFPRRNFWSCNSN